MTVYWEGEKMFSKIQQKLLGIKYVVDSCEQNGSLLNVRGWMCSSKYEISNVYFLIEDKKGNRFSVKGKYGITRSSF